MTFAKELASGSGNLLHADSTQPFGLEPIIKELASKRDSVWAWRNYLDVVCRLISELPARSVIEIGGGRSPSFSKEELGQMGVETYTSNDISARELSLAPGWVSKAHFDVQSPNAGEISPFAECYDLAFSRMVMEHVADYERAYRNIYTILRPGGIAIAFHPVLYSVPFVINRMIPEAASHRILKAMFPNRTDSGTPKFPAHYSGCRISATVRENIRDIGFSGVWQVPFYWHNYYQKIPVLRQMHQVVSKIVMRNDFTPLATFAYVVVRK